MISRRKGTNHVFEKHTTIPFDLKNIFSGFSILTSSKSRNEESSKKDIANKKKAYICRQVQICLSENCNSTENKSNCIKKSSLSSYLFGPNKLPSCINHNLDKGLGVTNDLREKEAEDKLSDNSKEDNLISDKKSLISISQIDNNPLEFNEESIKESSILRENKTTNRENHYEEIFTPQTHELVIVKYSSKENEEKNFGQSISQIDSLQTNTNLTSQKGNLSNNIIDLRSFRLCLSSKLCNAQKYLKNCKNFIPNENSKMWNSRNRILIDTDGDDVAFLSGSGRFV